MSEATARRRVMFLYWGRRGAGSRLALDVATATANHPHIDAAISISRSNELFDAFLPFGERIHAISTFDSGPGMVGNMVRLPALRRSLADALRRHRTEAVVVLMSHVWNPLVADAVKATGVKYAVIVHDVTSRSGRWGRVLHWWLLRDARLADTVLVLTEFVAAQLRESGQVRPERVATLFHPDFDYRGPARCARADDDDLRLLFFGRILPYKGLHVFVDALERLRDRGVAVRAGVYGDGRLGRERGRLARMEAEIRNNWIDDCDIPSIFSRYDALVLSHTQASQSGVAAAALGAGLPVVVTPVGGLPEQIREGVTGLVAERADAEAVATAVQRLAEENGLLGRMATNIDATRAERSMTSFLDAVIAAVLPRSDGSRIQ